MKADLESVFGTPTLSALQRLSANGRAPLNWGVRWGIIQAAAHWASWLDAATVYGMSIALIQVVYIGFSVTDGRPAVIAVGTTVAQAHSWCSPRPASPGRRGSSPSASSVKDLWQHRSHFVAHTVVAPFCTTIDWAVADIID